MKEFGTAAILCGGSSRRMGFDKALIKIKEKLLIEIIAEKLEGIFEEVIFIAKDKDKFSKMKYRVFTDEIPDSGPAGAIYTALKNTASKYIFITACDMPFVNPDYIRYMMKIISENKAEGAAAYNLGFIEPLYSFYSKDMLSTFQRKLESNNYKLNSILKDSNVFYIEESKVREFSKDLKIFTNLNYEFDLNMLGESFTEE